MAKKDEIINEEAVDKSNLVKVVCITNIRYNDETLTEGKTLEVSKEEADYLVRVNAAIISEIETTEE